MALINGTFKQTRNQKKVRSVAYAAVTPEDFGVSSDLSQLFSLPNDAVLLNTTYIVEEAFNAGTSITLGSDFEGTAVKTAISIATVGIKSSSVTIVDTGSGGIYSVIPTITGAPPTVGLVHVIVEYDEYTKNTGELTKYSATE